MKKFLLLILMISNDSISFHCSFAQSLEAPKFEVAFAAPQSFGKTHFIVGHPEESERRGSPVTFAHQPSE
jgi:hypothetical protein